MHAWLIRTHDLDVRVEYAPTRRDAERFGKVLRLAHPREVAERGQFWPVAP